MTQTPWLKTYPKDVPAEVETGKYDSLAELMSEAFVDYADLPAFENMGKTLSFKDMDNHSKAFGAYLLNKLHLKPGDKIAIQMPNLLQYPIAMFGALRAGLVVVNTNPLYTPSEMEHQFKDSEAKAIVILANFANNLEKIISNTQIEHVIVTEIGDMLGGLKGGVVNFVVKNVKKMVPAYNLPGAVNFKIVLANGAKQTFSPPKLTQQDLAFLQYTGGTTGVSKGAMLSHGNLVANLMQVNAWMKFGGLENGKEIIITALPIYHVFALVCNVLVSTEIGARNVLITNPRDMPAFIKEMGKHKFSVITGVNTLFNGLLNQPDFAKLDFSRLKFAFGGGMAVLESTANQWQKVTGKYLAEGYGLTETSPVLTANPLDGSGRIGSIGLPIPSTLLKLVDDDGNEVELGEKGELCAKGPQVMQGYYNRPEETAECMLGEWFKTGDIATMDEQGFFKIVDRKKEMILVSGFNVYPNEIENVIASHPGVLEVGAIGVPDKKSTEAVKVYIVKSDESLTEEVIKAYAKEKMTAYKCPKYITFTDELPKSNVGKIMRRLIKEADASTNTYA
ncbi:MAG: long-chain acyl-CoA synthetase [Cyclobacteriaceae bacterium]|jgi:long-chain acyl-CoA synthetase